MKKTQVALAALALVASTAALADGVSAYGTVDVGAIAADSGRVQMAGAGNNSATLIGFRGTEDIGNGLKASFNYEAGINARNGSLGNGGPIASSTIFNRVATVGLSTEAYGITLGTQLSPFIGGELTGATAVGGNGAFVPGLYVLNGGNLSGITTAATGATNGFFVPEAVNVNATISGVALNVMTRMGGGGSAESNYNAVSAGTTFADINANYAYQKVSTNGVITTNNVISANYQFGDIRINGAYASNSITGTDNRGSLIGASMPLNAAVSVGFTYARNSLSTLDNVRVASAEYKMSKRTYAYLNYATFGNSAMGVYGNDQGRLAASSTESLLMVGLSHSF